MLSDSNVVRLTQYFVDFLSGIFLARIDRVAVSEVHAMLVPRIKVQFAIKEIRGQEIYDLHQKFVFKVEPKISLFQKDSFIVEFIIDTSQLPGGGYAILESRK